MSILFMAVLAAGLIGPLDQTVVSPEWLEQNLDNPSVIVVEIGSSPAGARRTVSAATWPFGRDRHIPGARFVPIESIMVRNGWPPDELPPVNQLQRVFTEAGVSDYGRIVLYSANPLWATRAWFTLDYLGHGNRAAILDGGFDHWLAEGRPVATKRSRRDAATFTPKIDSTRVIRHPDMRMARHWGEAVLIDARPAEEFNGFHRGRAVVRRGHIPGAHCTPWQSNLRLDGRFLSAEELQDVYENLIPTPATRVIVYCRTGVEASMPYFVLRSLGYDVALYDGSFAEWSRDRSVAVAQLSLRP